MSNATILTTYAGRTAQSNSTLALLLANLAGSAALAFMPIQVVVPAGTGRTNQIASVALSTEERQVIVALQQLAAYLANSAQDLDREEKAALYANRWDLYG